MMSVWSGIFGFLQRNWCARLCALAALGLLNGRVEAHPESLSTLRVVLGPSKVHMILTLPVRDLTRWFPPGKYPNYMVDVVAQLKKEAGELLDVRWAGAAIQGEAIDVHRGEVGYIIAELDFMIAAGPGELLIHPLYFGNLPNDHQQVLTVVDERSGVPRGDILAEEMLNAQDDTLTIELPAVTVNNASNAGGDEPSRQTAIV